MSGPLWLIVGLAGGAIAAWLAVRGRTASLRGERVALERSLEQERADRATAADRLSQTERELERTRGRLEAELRASDEKLGMLERAKIELGDAFKALSAEALRTNNSEFLQLARTQLEALQQTAKHDLENRQRAVETLVQPIKESLGKVDAKLHDLERARLHAYATLNEQVRAMSDTQAQLRSETNALVTALRAPAVRGRWGEIQLRRVVELAGMVNRCDFVEQAHAESDNGRLRPDMIVRLPGGKNIVVDAKAPLNAYLEAIEAPSEHLRVLRMADHARQIRDHMQKLSQKAYWEQFQPAPEFVFMFLPGESFYSAALEQEPALIEDGASQRVILATPTTLIALLRAVSYGWQQETLAENAREISELGKSLHQRLGVFADHLGRVGRSLRGSVEAYNEAVGSFESRVLVTARRLGDYGVGSERDLGALPAVESSTRPLQAPELGAAGEPAPPDADPFP